jgi:hypothetical protein
MDTSLKRKEQIVKGNIRDDSENDLESNTVASNNNTICKL